MSQFKTTASPTVMLGVSRKIEVAKAALNISNFPASHFAIL